MSVALSRVVSLRGLFLLQDVPKDHEFFNLDEGDELLAQDKKYSRQSNAEVARITG